MKRRSFFEAAGVGTAGLASAAVLPSLNRATTPAMKITRVRFYHNPNSPAHFNQSFHIVTVETDQGITGIGEGGSKDTIEQCAAMIMGEDPARIDHLWQMMYRGYFYPAGREKLDALGAIDLALWDIKGKALGVPVYELLGGLARDHVECYSTSFPSHGSLKETARACIEAGEQFGSKWDVNRLIEEQLIDYARVTLRNVGGITEYMKIQALSETHYVGLIPHFTGPVSEAALVHACGVFSGPVLMEMLGRGPGEIPHLPASYDFKNGKMWPNRRPGLGVELDTKPLELVAEVTEHFRPIPIYHRPDGSLTNW